MVGLLRATELFGRPFKVLTWNTGDCFIFDKVIRNNLTSSDPTCVPDSGGSGKLQFEPGLEAQGLVISCSWSPHLQALPHKGYCLVQSTLLGAGTGEGWALWEKALGELPFGEQQNRPSPPVDFPS
jgi:hypothetical protein